MILISGVRYLLSSPRDEKELEDMVEEHAKDIFGEDCVYLNLKRKLTSKSGISSIPDGYVIRLREPFEWYIIEAELSTHPVHEHIVTQLSKFINGIKSLNTQKELIEYIYKMIMGDNALRARIQDKIGREEIHHLVSQVISKPPGVVVIIDEDGVVEDACQALNVPVRTIEFQTYIGEDKPLTHAHLFSPLYEEEAITVLEPAPRREPLKEGVPVYWLTPWDASDWDATRKEILGLLGEDHEYVYADRTPGRKIIKPGDWICFYATTRGVVAHARVASYPEVRRQPRIHQPDRYRWVFRLEEVQLYLDDPVVLDDTARDRLNAFEGQQSKGNWGWFVQSTRILSKHDFELLTRQDRQNRRQ